MQIFEGSFLVVFRVQWMKGLIFFWHQMEYLTYGQLFTLHGGKEESLMVLIIYHRIFLL